MSGTRLTSTPLVRKASAMDELASLSGLIGEIYDATLSPSLWPGVLGRISRFLRASGAALDCKDPIKNTVSVFFEDGGVEPSFLRLYNDKYGKLDPRLIITLPRSASRGRRRISSRMRNSCSRASVASS